MTVMFVPAKQEVRDLIERLRDRKAIPNLSAEAADMLERLIGCLDETTDMLRALAESQRIEKYSQL